MSSTHMPLQRDALYSTRRCKTARRDAFNSALVDLFQSIWRLKQLADGHPCALSQDLQQIFPKEDSGMSRDPEFDFAEFLEPVLHVE